MMKLNKKGFAITSIIYSMLILFLTLVVLIISNLASRKTVFDKQKEDILDKIQSLTLLPIEYQQIEYIEGTGTQYILTNYVPNSSSKVYFKFTTTKQLSDNFNCLIGSGLINATNTNFGFSVILENRTSELKFRSYADTLNATGKIINQNETHNYILEYGKLICDDIEYTGNTDLSSGNMSELYIFARYFKQSDAAGISKGKLYNLKVEENSITKMNLIPCYRKSDNEVGLYDLVNDVFYTNQGTGEFAKGADV